MTHENTPHIKGAAYAMEAIRLCAGNHHADARLTMARAIPKHGNYDAAGKALWADYAKAGAPSLKAIQWQLERMDYTRDASGAWVEGEATMADAIALIAQAESGQ